MGLALAKLAEEDPTFRTWTDEETGQTIIAGMGELHLEIIVDRLLREFKVEANVGAPQVAYKETIKKSVEQDTKYARQSGGKGQYGHVRITVEPNEPGKGYEFLNEITGGVIPKEYIPAVDAGIQAMQAGVLAGYPVVDVKVHLTFGSYHEVDSSEMAFKIAGSMAFKEACRKADAILLEPVMKVSVIVPDEYLGNVIGDLTSRRGMIQGQESRPAPLRWMPWCPWPACSATPRTCVLPLRAAASTPWSPTAMWRSPRALPRRLSRSGAARTINFRPLAFLATRVLHFILQCYTIFSHYCGNKNHLTIRI